MDCAVYLTFTGFFVDFWGNCSGIFSVGLGCILLCIFGSIFDLFLDAALLVRDVFHGVLCDWTPVFGPFLARLFTVHFIVHFISDAT